MRSCENSDCKYPFSVENGGTKYTREKNKETARLVFESLSVRPFTMLMNFLSIS